MYICVLIMLQSRFLSPGFFLNIWKEKVSTQTIITIPNIEALETLYYGPSDPQRLDHVLYTVFGSYAGLLLTRQARLEIEALA